MPFHGFLRNFKYPEHTLTLDGSDKWTRRYKYGMVSLMSQRAGAYVGWDFDMNLVMTQTEYWWQVTVLDGKDGLRLVFQVPHESESAKAESLYTFQLEDDRETLKLVRHAGEFTKAQQWAPDK